MLFELSHENTGFKALHFHGKETQFKLGLPLALSKLSKQSIFQKIERLSRVVTDIKSIQNVPKDLLGQAGKGVGILEVLWFDSCHSKLGLDEAEPNVWFFLIIGTKFNLSSCCCIDRGGQIVMRHVCKFGKGWQSPKVWWALVPRKIKIGSHCRANERTNWRRCGKFGSEKKINCRLKCDTHKKVRANRFETAQENKEKKNTSNEWRVQRRALW